VASQIRRDLEGQFEAEYGEWLDAVGQARERVLRKFPRSAMRTRLLQRIASKGAYRKFAQDRRKQVQR
jgi:siroheme synthase (precorrin-2 oxidase/ferrochelatase)